MAEITRHPLTKVVMEVKPWDIAKTIAKIINWEWENKTWKEWQKIEAWLLLQEKQKNWQKLINILELLTKNFSGEKIEIACRDTSCNMWTYWAINRFLNSYNWSSESVKKMLIDFVEQNWLRFQVDKIVDYVWWPTKWIKLLLVKKQ